MIKIDESTILEKRSFTKEDFPALYEYFNKKLFDFVLKRVSNKEIAEDLTSEIFEKIYKSIADFKWQGITISAWIFRIARNRIIDHYRANNKYKKDTSLYDLTNIIQSNDPKADDIMVEKQEHQNLYNAIREFDEEEQYLIYYKFFEDMQNKDISRLTGISETNVGTKLHRIRRRLEKLIKKLETKNDTRNN